MNGKSLANTKQTAHPAPQPAITADDLHEAYKASGLRRQHIGFQTALLTPLFEKCLRNAALAKKKKQQEQLPLAA